MTRDEEFEAALQARKREDDISRSQAHARFLRTPFSGLTRSECRRAERENHARRVRDRHEARP